jgi:phosphoribosylformylglycinamidine synthase
MIGLVEDKAHITGLAFPQKGELIYMIGECREDINQSQYLVAVHGIEASPVPSFSLEEEYANQEQVKMLIRHGAITAAHDVSEGGLFIALLEMAMAGNLGFDITTDASIRKDAFLFGENQSRMVVTVSQDKEEAFLDLMMLNGVEFDLVGHVTKGAIRVDDEDWGDVDHYRNLYDTAIEKEMSK